MQVIAFNSRVMIRSTMRQKIKRRLKEAVRLIVTRGAAVEESRMGLKLVFRAEDVGADKWIAPGVLLLLLFHGPNCVVIHDGLSRRLDVCCFAHLRDVQLVVCGITQLDASSTHISSSVHSRS